MTEKKVLDNVSVDVKKGTITSFIGPNGAGKSTLISLISRIAKKDSGEVLIDGKEIESYKSKDLAKKDFDFKTSQSH